MRNIVGLRVRNTNYPWVVGKVIAQYDAMECPTRPGFPRYVTVTWDDGVTAYFIPLSRLESAS